ncbi:MAG: DUF1446 domain-containing protein [Desulfurococcales archaeon]|nr:DUF1446 domain-containing protein [Desulfurococcales archaeon]
MPPTCESVGGVEIRVLSPTAILGYGFPLESLRRGLAMEPDVIGVDAGSTDPGPYYLGEGIPFVSEHNVERDLYFLLKAVGEKGIPLIIGTAGGSGAEPHVRWLLGVIERVLKRLGARLRVGVIWSDVSKEWLLSKLEEGAYIEDLSGYLGPLSPSMVKSSTRIVAQLGLEPFMKALKEGFDVIVGGRSVDVAPFASLPVMKGFDKGLAIHMAKILECGAIAAEPGSGSDGMIGILRKNEFEVIALNPSRRATPLSVAEHSLYERTDPYREYVPGGYVDLSNVTYEESPEGVVVKGARWIESDRYLVKVEGVKLVGHRVVVIMGARDPDFIGRLDYLLDSIMGEVKTYYGNDGFEVHVHVYGRNAVLGPVEPEKTPCHEVCILLDVIADTPEKAKALASYIRARLLHIGWPGRKTTAGNVAFPLSPSDLYVGRAYRWSIWHLVELRDPLELGKITGGGG